MQSSTVTAIIGILCVIMIVSISGCTSKSGVCIDDNTVGIGTPCDKSNGACNTKTYPEENCFDDICYKQIKVCEEGCGGKGVCKEDCAEGSFNYSCSGTKLMIKGNTWSTEKGCESSNLEIDCAKEKECEEGYKATCDSALLKEAQKEETNVNMADLKDPDYWDAIKEGLSEKICTCKKSSTTTKKTSTSSENEGSSSKGKTTDSTGCSSHSDYYSCGSDDKCMWTGGERQECISRQTTSTGGNSGSTSTTIPTMTSCDATCESPVCQCPSTCSKSYRILKDDTCGGDKPYTLSSCSATCDKSVCRCKSGCYIGGDVHLGETCSKKECTTGTGTELMDCNTKCTTYNSAGYCTCGCPSNCVKASVSLDSDCGGYKLNDCISTCRQAVCRCPSGCYVNGDVHSGEICGAEII